MERIALYLGKLNPLGLLALLISVIRGLTGNTNFATPAVPVATLQTLHDRLQNAIEAARIGGKQSKMERDAVVREVKAALRTEADYVTLIGAGDGVKLLSSGFSLAQPNVPVERVEVPRYVRVSVVLEESGVLDIRWPSVHGAHGYEMYMADKDPSIDGNWENIGFTTRVRHTGSGLESGKKYWFAVKAVGANSISALSTPGFGRAA